MARIFRHTDPIDRNRLELIFDRSWRIFFSNPDRSKFLEIDERVRNQSSSNLFCLMSLNSPFMTIFHKLPLTKESQSPVNFYGADLFPLFLPSNDLVSRVL